MIRIILCSFLLIVVAIDTHSRCSKKQLDITQMPDGRWRYAFSVGGEWVKEEYYTKDSHALVERRYWDCLGRMVEIEYGEDGLATRRSIRE